MRTAFIVKLNFLLLGLFLTGYTMHQLNGKGLSPQFLSAFGIATTPEARSKNTTWLNWCETRVTGIIRPDEFKLVQEGNNWTLEEGTKRVVNFIEVEKWFAANCRVSVRLIETPSFEGFAPALLVKFVTGHVEVLALRSDGLFKWQNKTFQAEGFQEAISAIKNLSDGRSK